ARFGGMTGPMFQRTQYLYRCIRWELQSEARLSSQLQGVVASIRGADGRVYRNQPRQRTHNSRAHAGAGRRNCLSCSEISMRLILICLKVARREEKTSKTVNRAARRRETIAPATTHRP